MPHFRTDDGVPLADTDRGDGRSVVLVNGCTDPLDEVLLDLLRRTA